MSDVSTGETTRGWWSSFSRSIGELRYAQKTKKGVPVYSLYINRPAGRVIAAMLRYTSVTPNQITLAGAVLTYGSLLWLAFSASNFGAAAIIGICLLLGFVLDSADGQLARLQGRSSLLGEWLDHILDNGRIALMHFAVLGYAARTTDLPVKILVLVCGSFMVSSSVIFFGSTLVDQLLKKTNATSSGPANLGKSNRSWTIRSIITLPVDYGITCLTFLLLPWPMIFFSAYSIIAIFHVLFCMAYLIKWRIELARMN